MDIYEQIVELYLQELEGLWEITAKRNRDRMGNHNWN